MPLTSLVQRTTLLATALLASACARPAASPAGPSPTPASHALGHVEFPVACSASVQEPFAHAVALLHHMTYPGARQAFQEVAELDPTCAMAHWGVAMTLFQPLWPTRPDSVALHLGWAAVERARSLGPAPGREQLLVEAAAAFFRNPAAGDYWDRIRRWERAMAEAHAALPDDPEVTAFYALAILAAPAAPADSNAAAPSARAAALLLRLHARNPQHPGVVHYLIHANDVTGREHESPEIVRSYGGISPRNPHALHMPTHIYTRLGAWEAVIAGNVAAAAAALEHPAGDRGQFVWDEFPHAIEYLVYAHLQRGDDAGARHELERLRATERLEPTFKTAFHLASTAARYALERRDWAAARALVPREQAFIAWDRFPWPEAVTWFARGLGAARNGEADSARAAVARLATLEAAARAANEDLFARNIQLLRLETEAWIAHLAGKADSSVALMQAAVELEAATPKHAVTPAPTLPAYELLGDLLREQRRPAEALVAYQRSLELYPRRFNSVLGAACAAREAGKDAVARKYFGELGEIAVKSARRVSSPTVPLSERRRAETLTGDSTCHSPSP